MDVQGRPARVRRRNARGRAGGSSLLTEAALVAQAASFANLATLRLGPGTLRELTDGVPGGAGTVCRNLREVYVAEGPRAGAAGFCPRAWWPSSPATRGW